MKANDPHAGLISGKIGNLIYYVMNGKQYVRRAAIPGKKRKVETEGISPQHQQQINRFSIVQSYYSFFRVYVSDKIWKTAAPLVQSRPHNLFHRVNSPCFNGQGELIDFATFRFSFGELQLPRNISIERDGDHYVVTWEEERTGALAAADDRLYIGIIYDAKPGAPRLIKEVSGKRGDMRGTFRPDKNDAGTMHVYCFFGREDETAFSESLYFKMFSV